MPALAASNISGYINRAFSLGPARVMIERSFCAKKGEVKRRPLV